jgi:hypothetical protein
MIRYQIIYWRDIPVRIRVRSGNQRTTSALTPRFQKTVHRAAYRAKAISGEAYVQEWHTSGWQVRDGGVTDVITAVTDELESAFSDERLDKLALNKGYEPDDD